MATLAWLIRETSAAPWRPLMVATGIGASSPLGPLAYHESSLSASLATSRNTAPCAFATCAAV